MKKIFYKFVSLSLSFYNNFFFKNLTIIGKEKIPKDGAVIFSPNHQSALLDALLVGVTNGKSVYSLTRSDVFRRPFKWILSAMQTLPIYRLRDGYEMLHRNKETFDNCYNLLNNKNNLMIFSEGKHHDKYFLLPISKGSSRIGMESLKKFPKTKIYLQAVGINYGSHFHPFHNCTIVYGNPIKLNGFINYYKKKPAETLNKVKLKLETEMKLCLWLPNYSKDYNIKRYLINYKSTKLEFNKLKNKISKKDNKLQNNNYETVIEKGAIIFFSIFNIFPLIFIRYILEKIEDNVFHLTIKYLTGIFVFPLWWMIVFCSSVYFLNLYSGLIIISILILFVFLRQFLIIRYK